MCIELKDWILFIAGIVVGFFFSIAAYWWPLGQFKNECKALWNLKKKYLRGEIIIVKTEVDLKPINSIEKTLSTFSEFKMQVANDEGVGWHHTSNGWVRGRILHVYKANTGEIEPLYKICHLDLV